MANGGRIFTPDMIEHAFAHFFRNPIGDRTTAHDADAIRAGSAASLAEIAELIPERIQGILAESGSSATEQVTTALRMIEEAAGRLRISNQRYPDDPHWQIIAGLVYIIDDWRRHNAH